MILYLKKSYHIVECGDFYNERGDGIMAQRYVFISKSTYPYYEKIYVSLDWFGGHALSQKRKCEIGLHQNFLAVYYNYKCLEISGASLMLLGNDLSAMNLSKKTSQGLTTVESAFQSSRVYSDGERRIGPFHEYLFAPGKESKKRVKEASEGLISREYSFDGMTFYAPDYHISLFYDYLYMNALLEEENQGVLESLLEGGYNAFSDLATLSINSQARSAAIFVGLYLAGKLDEIKEFDSYLKLFRTDMEGKALEKNAYENVQLLDAKGKEEALSPIVPISFNREQVEAYYQEHCSMLNNKRNRDNYIR